MLLEKKISGLVITLGIILLICFFSVYTLISYPGILSNVNLAKNQFSLEKIAVQLQSSENINLQSTELPLNSMADVVSIRNNEKIVVAGSGTLLISHDGGASWNRIKKGKGFFRITANGGKSFINSNNNSLGEIDIEKMCQIETARLTDSGLFFAKTNCSDSSQIWSIPIEDMSKNWFVTTFTHESESSKDTYLIRPNLKSVGNKIFISSILPQGHSLLTTNDDGFTWVPFWTSPSERIVDYDFLSEDLIFVLTNQGNLIQISNYGQKQKIITTIPEQIADEIRGMLFVDLRMAILVGQKGLIMITNDQGKSWKSFNVSPTVNWYKAIASDDKNIIWISGDSDEILAITNEGQDVIKKILNTDEGVYSRLNTYNNKAYVTSGSKLFSLSINKSY